MGQLVSRALKLVPPDSHQAARLLCGHLYALGTPPQDDYEGSREALSRALDIARRDKDTALEARALARAGTLDLRHLRWQESVDKALGVVGLARDLDDPLSEWEARFATAIILRVLGDPEEARVQLSPVLPSQRGCACARIWPRRLAQTRSWFGRRVTGRAPATSSSVAWHCSPA